MRSHLLSSTGSGRALCPVECLPWCGPPTALLSGESLSLKWAPLWWWRPVPLLKILFDLGGIRSVALRHDLSVEVSSLLVHRDRSRWPEWTSPDATGRHRPFVDGCDRPPPSSAQIPIPEGAGGPSRLGPSRGPQRFVWERPGRRPPRRRRGHLEALWGPLPASPSLSPSP